MRIESNIRLGAAKLTDVLALMERVRLSDGIRGDVYTNNEYNFNRHIKCFYTAYADERPEDMTGSVKTRRRRAIGFLSLFIPSPDSAEISAYVDPEYRRCGIFRRLLQKANAELELYDIKTRLFVTETASCSGQEVIKHMGLRPEHSEYLMRYDRRAEVGDDAQAEKSEQSQNIRLLHALQTDKEQLLPITATFFPMTPEENESWYDMAMNSRDIRMYKLTEQDRIIGAANISVGMGDCCIFGVGVYTELRGRGYGQRLVQLLVDEITREFPSRRIVLEVSSTNAVALHVYRKSGFVVDSQVDYYM